MAPRFRWRTRLRRHLPQWLIDLGLASKGRSDCGEHDWYNVDDLTERCYHCEVGERDALSAGFMNAMVTG